ncbi:hypothetical protein V3C99_008099 [Haemonchus contortus]
MTTAPTSPPLLELLRSSVGLSIALLFVSPTPWKFFTVLSTTPTFPPPLELLQILCGKSNTG